MSEASSGPAVGFLPDSGKTFQKGERRSNPLFWMVSPAPGGPDPDMTNPRPRGAQTPI
jgi:hypothetical protein